MIELLLKGILIGMIIGIPASPNGLLCLKQNIINKNQNGHLIGLGVSSADFVYSIIAGLGLTIIFDFVINERGPILLFGAIAFILLGIKDLFFFNKYNSKNTKEYSNPLKEYLFGFFVTLANPFTVIAIMIGYSLIGINKFSSHPFSIILLIIGTFIGSLILWLSINILIINKKQTIKKYLNKKIFKISGILFIIFGFILLVKSVTTL